ncbi:MAG: hypothetical protein R3B70_45970 [Polyangiaceae bacterium]
MTKSSLLIALPITIAALSACSPPPPPNDGGATGPASTGDVSTSNTEPAPTAGATGSPTTTASSSASGTLNFECRVPAPVKSEDKCTTDADCGVSDPCHAHACVAKAKSNPPKKDTMCTEILDCRSADRNPCVCFEGVCALVPPQN